MLTRIFVFIFGVLSQSVLCDKLDDFHTQLLHFIANRTASDVSVALEAQGIATVVHSSRFKVYSPCTSDEEATPVVQMHGMGDFAQDPLGATEYANHRLLHIFRHGPAGRGYIGVSRWCVRAECADWRLKV